MRFGASGASLGDLDEDGLVDVVVGAPSHYYDAASRGSIYVLFLHGNDTVKEVSRVSQAAGQGLDNLPVTLT